MTTRSAFLALAVCLTPAAALAQTAAADLPRLSTSISEQTSKIALDLDQSGQTGQAPKPIATPKAPQPASYKQKHWGVSGSFMPKWKMWGKVTDTIADEGEVWNIEGQQFAIGFVHGRSRGGDFGVEYVVQRVKNGSSVKSSEQDCVGNNGAPPCFTLNSSDTLQDVKMAGVKVHFYIPFVTIKGRVQAGINIGAGAAQISGTDNETEDQLNFVPNTPPQQGGVFKKTTVTKTENMKDVFDLPVIPLFDFDVAVGFIITPALKVRYMAGIGIPGITKFQIMGTYLFGAH